MRTNPFGILNEFMQRTVYKQKAEERDAEARLQSLLLTYRTLCQDTRYKQVVQDLEGILREQLGRLLTQASACAHCAPHAERVLLLKDIIHAPIDAVLMAKQEEQAVESSHDVLDEANELAHVL